MARGSKGAGGRGGKGTGGGGASPGGIRAGGAFVELFAKDDKLQAGLKSASGKLRVWAESIKKIGTGEMFSGALGGGPIGLAIAGGAALAKAAFSDFVLDQREMAREVERTATLTDRWLANFQAGIEKTRARIADFADVAGTSAGLDNFEAAISEAKKNLGGLEISLKSVQQQHDELNKIFSSKENFSLWLSGPITGGLAGEQAKLKPGLDAANEAYAKQLALVTELQKKLSEVNDPSKSREAMAALRAFTDKLAEETDKLTSTASNRARELQKIASQFGFGSASPEFLQAMDAVKKADVAGAIEGFVKAINSQTERIENADLSDAEFNFKKLAEQNDWGPANPEWQRGMEALKNNRIAEAVAAAQKWAEDWEPATMGGSTKGTFNAGNYSQFLGGGGAMGDIKKGIEKQNALTEQLITALKSVPLARL